MNSRHQATLDTEGRIQYLHDGCQTIRGTRGIRDHRMRGSQDTVIHAKHHSRIDILAARRRDDYLFSATLQVG